MTDDIRPAFRAARKLLRAVAILHQQGFQRLRIAPYMNDAGSSWRCVFYPKGTKPDDIDPMVMSYIMGFEYRYFAWKKVQRDYRRQSAVKVAYAFETWLPTIMRQCVGSDDEYVRWFQNMLDNTGEARLPCCHFDERWYTVTYRKSKSLSDELRGPPEDDAWLR